MYIKIDGEFECNENKLISLKGCPDIVKGNFDCSRNKLITLEGGPKWVGEDVNCEFNELISLKGAPEYIGGTFWTHGNNIKYLEGCPKIVEHDFIFSTEFLKKPSKNEAMKIKEKILSMCNVGGEVLIVPYPSNFQNQEDFYDDYFDDEDDED